MSTNQGQILAYVLSLVGGLIILVASLVNVVWFGAGSPNFGGFGGYMRGIMDGYTTSWETTAVLLVYLPQFQF